MVLVIENGKILESVTVTGSQFHPAKPWDNQGAMLLLTCGSGDIKVLENELAEQAWEAIQSQADARIKTTERA